MNGSISANATMASNLASDLRALHAQDRAVQEDVLAPGQLRVEPGSDLEQRPDAAAQLHLARSVGSVTRDEDLQQGALAGTVRADEPQRGPARHLERHVPQRPEQGDPARQAAADVRAS